MKFILKHKILLLIISLSMSIGFSFYSNLIIEYVAKDKTFSTTDRLPKNKVGLVLGTAKTLQNGDRNLFFTHRINATVSLYKKGKIEYILVSGDNSSSSYDEPNDFKTELIKKGIPSSKIVLDYAGFRTLDSIIRAKKVFDLESFTVISQQFHNERAIFLASKYSLEVVGFNAKNVPGKMGFKVKLREFFARTKACLDILINKSPKFLGKPIQIGSSCS